MKTIPIDEQMRQVGERAGQRDVQKFHKKYVERSKQERAQQGQRDIEASADMPHQATESQT